MKKIVFFDGDGTLWYPKTTKRTRIPWWIYDSFPNSFLDHLELDPDTVETLYYLKTNNVKTILLSTHPDSLENPLEVLRGKIIHLGIGDILDDFFATEEYREAKPKKILELLESLKIDKKHALMVGDSYNWDYRPAERYGIDVVLIDSLYHQERKETEPAKRMVEKLAEIIKYVYRLFVN